MHIVRMLGKGQVVIPKSVRRQFAIEEGTALSLDVEGQRLILEPLPDDPVAALCGMFGKGTDLVSLRKKLEKEETAHDAATGA